jgi:hypothetical protein
MRQSIWKAENKKGKKKATGDKKGQTKKGPVVCTTTHTIIPKP